MSTPRPGLAHPAVSQPVVSGEVCALLTAPLSRARSEFAVRLAALSGLPRWRVEVGFERVYARRVPSWLHVLVDAACLLVAAEAVVRAGLDPRACLLGEDARPLASFVAGGSLSEACSHLLELAADVLLAPAEEEMSYDPNWPEDMRRFAMPAPAGARPGDRGWAELGLGERIGFEVCTDFQYEAHLPALEDPADLSPLGTRLCPELFLELPEANVWSQAYDLLRRAGLPAPSLDFRPGYPLPRRLRLGDEVVFDSPRQRRLVRLRGTPWFLWDVFTVLRRDYRDARRGLHCGVFASRPHLRVLARPATSEARRTHAEIAARLRR